MTVFAHAIFILLGAGHVRGKEQRGSLTLSGLALGMVAVVVGDGRCYLFICG